MYKLSNGLLLEALNELYVKNDKIHHYPTRNYDRIIFKQVLIVSARI